MTAVALLLRRLLGERPALIPQLLDAQAKMENAELALKAATGKDARAEYALLVRRFWGVAKP